MKNDLQLDQATACPNCGTVIAGNFCQGCGQAAHLHVPSAREFLHEFIAHYVALEGKLWKSVALLLFRPGRLTRDYIEGKRARYVEPLRLYLSFSIIFFAIFKLGGAVSIGDGIPDTPPAREAQASAEQKAGNARDATVSPLQRAQEQVREERRLARQKNEDRDLIHLGEGEGAKAEQFAAAIHPALGKKVESFNALPEKDAKAAVMRALSSYTPYAIFAVMPVFAALSLPAISARDAARRRICTCRARANSCTNSSRTMSRWKENCGSRWPCCCSAPGG